MRDVGFPDKGASLGQTTEPVEGKEGDLLWVLHLLEETQVDPLEEFGLGLPRVCEDRSQVREKNNLRVKNSHV